MLRRYLRSMGSCIGYNNRGSRGSESSEDNPTLSHNRPLKHRKPKWKSNIRLTETQLRAKREEFWDTAPAFEGRREIWDALKASVSALESGDYQMAQVILDGANISLPNGTLMDCYDELGNRYQLPVYILSAPINMIQEGDEEDEGEDEEEAKLRVQGGRKKELEGKQINIRIRFSTGDDRKLTVNTSENVAAVKRSLARCSPGIDPNAVRFFFAGKQLYNKMTLSSAKVESNYTIQALIVEPSPSHTPVLQAISVKSKSERQQSSSKSHKQSSSSIQTHKFMSRQKIEVKQALKQGACEKGKFEEANSSKSVKNVANYNVDGYNSMNNGVNSENVISNNNNNNSISCNYNTIPPNILYNYINENPFNQNLNEQKLTNPHQETELSARLFDGVNVIVNEGDRHNSSYNVDPQQYANKLYPMCHPLETNDQQIDIKLADAKQAFVAGTKLQSLQSQNNCQQQYCKTKQPFTNASREINS